MEAPRVLPIRVWVSDTGRSDCANKWIRSALLNCATKIAEGLSGAHLIFNEGVVVDDIID
ncbi:MAG: hypothetical protein QXX94_07315 [Candidatus Bathyarchaeia archaeon]